MSLHMLMLRLKLLSGLNWKISYKVLILPFSLYIDLVNLFLEILLWSGIVSMRVQFFLLLGMISFTELCKPDPSGTQTLPPSTLHDRQSVKYTTCCRGQLHKEALATHLSLLDRFDATDFLLRRWWIHRIRCAACTASGLRWWQDKNWQT